MIACCYCCCCCCICDSISKCIHVKKKYRIAIIGDPKVNKISIVNRIMKFNNTNIDIDQINKPIDDISNLEKTLRVEESKTNVKLYFSIFDTDGNFNDDFYREVSIANGVILAFNIDDYNTFLPIIRVFSIIRESSYMKSCVITGIDSGNGWFPGLEDKAKKLNKRVHRYNSNYNNDALFLTDTYSNQNISEMFQYLSKELYNEEVFSWRGELQG